MLKHLLLLTVALSSLEAYNILLISPTPIVGQWLYFEEFIRELLSRGHHVSAITSYNIRSKHENYTAIVIPAFDIQKHYPSKDIFLDSNVGASKILWMNWKIGLLNSEHVLRNPKVQELIKNNKKEFDAVIADYSNHESLYTFAYKFKCPLIAISPNGHSNTMDNAVGLLTPLSFVSHPLLTFTEEMTFLQRAQNILLVTYESVLRRFNYLPAQNKLVKKYFGDAVEGEIPHVIRMEKNISIMLVNSHKSLQMPRPTMPGQINIAGAHVRKPNALPKDLTEFFNSAEHGVIVFSFGTYLKSTEIPKEKYDVLIETFKGIKQKVLWKIDTPFPENLPPNVLARGWIPQNDILANEKVVLFITHGGSLGVQEALHHGVPMLVIPFFPDHQKAAAHAQRGGYGLSLQFDDITKETFINAIEEITGNASYKQNAVKASERFKDFLVEPLVEAIFWIEYSIKNNGAQHLKSKSVNFSYCKYLMVDVLFFFFLIFALSFLTWVCMIRCCINRYRAKEHKGKFKYY